MLDCAFLTWFPQTDPGEGQGARVVDHTGLCFSYMVSIGGSRGGPGARVVYRTGLCLSYMVSIGESRGGPGGTCCRPYWTVPFLHGFHRRIQGSARGHVL